MRQMLTNLQYRVLKWISPGVPNANSCSGSVYAGKSKLQILLGNEFLRSIAGKTIIDFGCGHGTEAIEMAQRGGKRVIGIDIREEVLRTARQNAVVAGVQKTCSFTSSTNEVADVIVSIDAFEHFADPALILHIMDTLLSPGGEVLISFGPTWYHPLGGHLFSAFPWAHLLFSEEALIRWRSTFKADGAKRFGEVAGGLNQITIKRFIELIEKSAFKIARIEPVPIKKLRFFHNRFTREFTTAIVRCRLVKRATESLQTEMRCAS
jgi:SAM-dependent methyltransferase